jgi:hypothetical protein
VWKIERSNLVKDKYGNEIYITKERWEHIYERHPEIKDSESLVIRTIRLGKRRQQDIDPDKFKYYDSYEDLPNGNTQIIVIVKFGQKKDEYGNEKTNNFVITAYMK